MTADSWRSLPHNQVLPECSSTSDLVRTLGEAGAPHGTWVSAERQTAGRGRSGNSWASEPGNLFLSVLLRLEAPSAIWTWVPIIVALAVRDCILELQPDLKSTLKIKWPNDLWLNGKKSGGILCEGVGSRSGSYIVAGIGLNCGSAPQAVGVETSRVDVSVEELRRTIPGRILTLLKTAEPSELSRHFMECAQFSAGVLVQWRDRFDPAKILGEGTVVGLGQSGELLVKLTDGSLQRLYSEEVSLRSAP